jgi:hypothetical protein
MDVLRAVGEGGVADHLEEVDHATVGHRQFLPRLDVTLAGTLLFRGVVFE